jgi:hypothetical protein
MGPEMPRRNLKTVKALGFDVPATLMPAPTR